MKGKSISLLKALTREQLLGNYTKLSSYVTLYILIHFTINNIVLSINIGGILAGMVAGLLGHLLISLFTVGFIRVCIKVIRGSEPNIGDFFYVLKHDPDKIIIISSVLWVFSELVILPLYIPSSFGAALGMSRGALIFVRCLLVSVFIVLYIYAHILLGQCYFIYFDHPEFTSSQIFEMSINIMRNNKGRYFYLLFNAACMILLMIVTLGIGIYWMLPYMFGLMTNFYDDVKVESLEYLV